MKTNYNSKFKIGFEIEMVFNGDNISFENLTRKFQRLLPGITTGHDGSIDLHDSEFYHPGDIEIKTPPLLVEPAFKLLKKVFNLVKRYGKTNHSTGFHINISPIHNKTYHSLDPFKLIKSHLWNRIKREFNREKNEYCKSLPSCLKFKNNLDLFHKIGEALSTRRVDGEPLVGKYNAISFRNYKPIREASSRIEIRAMGGTNYHNKYNLIKKHTDLILTEFMKSCKV